MGPNSLMFGWNRSIPGREKLSAQHFEDFVGYLTAQQQKKAIDGFDVVFLDGHGGDLNGCFLIKADPAKLQAFAASEEWIKHMMRAALHLEGSGAIRGVTGNAVMDRMKLWTSLLPALPA